MKSAKTRSRTSERGVTLLMVAISIAVLLAIAALAIDVGVLYTARTSAQHAVDAAALAGAYTFANAPTAAQPDTAANAVKGVLKANTVLGNQVNLDSLSVIDNSGHGCAATVATPPFICVDSAKRRVTVAAAGAGATTVEVYFAKIIGLSNVAVAAMASAEAAKTAAGTYCLKPFYMPDQLGNNCSGGSIFNADGTLNSADVGKPITLWDNNQPSQWGLLALGGKGGANLRSVIATCETDTAYKCGDTFGAEPGRKVGPVMQGVDDLITGGGKDNPDVWVSVGQYKDGDTGNLKDTSRSLVPVVVWDCTDPVGNGRNGSISVTGFAEIFIDSANHNGNGSGSGIAAHLVNATQCTAGSGGGTGTGPNAIPVRLIQTPSGQ